MFLLAVYSAFKISAKKTANTVICKIYKRFYVAGGSIKPNKT
jgi:hypothetical protein